MAHWSPQYEIGEDHIDHQHQELFELVTMLDNAILTNDPTCLEKIILFLEDYSKEHFAEEETFMASHQYPGIKHHQHEHDKLKTLISHLRHIYDEGHPAFHLIFEIRRLIDQLVNHIQTVDIDIATFMKEKSS